MSQLIGQNGAQATVEDIINYLKNQPKLFPIGQAQLDPTTGYAYAYGGIHAATWGVAADTGNHADQTAALQAMATWIVTNGYRGKIIFPDGDIYHSGTINFTQIVNDQYPAITVLPVATWPEFESLGTTTFHFTTQGADAWTFSSGGTGVPLVKLRMRGLKFQGPGISVTNTTLAATLGAAAFTCSMTAAPAQGDAICISADVSANTGNLANSYTRQSSPEWWATVLSVTGTGPYTVTFGNASFGATPTNFSATSGNVVQIFKQTRALKFGGIWPGVEDVHYNYDLEKVEFADYFSCVAENDMTLVKWGRQVQASRCMFMFERGYNVDNVTYEQPQTLCQIQPVTGSVTSTQKTITITGDFSSILKPGMSMTDTTGIIANPPVLAFPEEATVQSAVYSAPNTTVTMSHASTVTGTRVFQPVMGIMMAMGNGTSPFWPKQTVGGSSVDGKRTDCDNTRVIQAIQGEARMLLRDNDGDGSGMLIEDFYSELCQRIAILGNQGGPTFFGPFIFKRGKYSSGLDFSGPPIEVVATSNASLEISDIEGSGAGSFPFLRMNLFNSLKLKWERVNYAVNANAVAAGLQTFVPSLFMSGFTPGASDKCYFANSTNPDPSGYKMIMNLGGVTNQNTVWVDEVLLTLTAASTFNDITWNPAPRGAKMRITATQNATGGYTLALGSNFVNAAGAAIGTIAAGTANKVCVMDFTNDGVGAGRWILTGGSASFI